MAIRYQNIEISLRDSNVELALLVLLGSIYMLSITVKLHIFY